MKVLRFLLILAVVLLAYLGQYLFGNDLRQAIPFQSSIDALPGVSALLTLPADQLTNWAAGLLLAAGLLFGLVATSLPRPARSAARSPRELLNTSNKSSNKSSAGDVPGRSSAQAGPVMVGIGLLCGLFNLLWLAGKQEESWLVLAVWVIGIGAVVAGGWQLSRSAGEGSPGAETDVSPESGWPVLLLILVAVLAVGLWRLADLPVEVDGDTASHGLQVLAMLSGQEPRLFAPGWAKLPLLTFVPSALTMMFTGELLFGVRLASVFAGLMTVLGTWLLGCEILRRPPRFGPMGEVIEDDGRWGALMAAGVVAGSITLLHYSRIPEYLDPVGWGVLGLWAFLRGFRTRNPLALAVSGLLIGVAGSVYFSGRIFLPVILVWIVGILLIRREWLRVSAPGTGGQGLWVWSAGFLAALGPVAGYWVQDPSNYLERVRAVSIFTPPAFEHLKSVFGVETQFEVFLASLRQALFTFNTFADKSPHFGYEGAMLNELIGPILALGIGYALVRLFRLPGWLLLSWFGGVVLGGGALTVDAPTWTRMLPVLPALGLLVALGLDRLRVSLVDNGGRFLDQVTLLAVVGLVLVAGAQNFRDYVGTMGYQADQNSYIGRAAAERAPDRPIWVYAGDAPNNGRWGDRVPEFLSGRSFNGRQGQDIGPGQWQELLTPGSTIMFHGADRAVVEQVMGAYPGGALQVWRNREAVPVFYTYTLPE